MRVIHVIFGRCNPESANGVDKTVYHLARHQAALGAKVAVFSLTNKEPLPIPGVDVQSFPSPQGFWARLVPFAPERLVQAILEWKPRLVHFHSVHIGPFVGIGRRLKQHGVPYVVTPHGAFAPGRLARVPPWVRAYIRLVEKSYLEGAAFVHAVSQNDVEGLAALGIRAKAVVVPNGVDLSIVPTVVDANLLFHRFPTLRGKRIFLFLGRLDPLHKGLDILLEAFAQANCPEAALVLVGPDWRGSLERLKAHVQRLGLEGRVLFTGPAYGEEKWSYLAGADVFVHPSRWEGFPFSVLEAIAMGKPVLATPVADPDNVLAKLGLGFIVSLATENLAETIRMLVRIPQEELRQVGTKARESLRQFGWDEIAKKLLDEYVGIR